MSNPLAVHRFRADTRSDAVAEAVPALEADVLVAKQPDTGMVQLRVYLSTHSAPA